MTDPKPFFDRRPTHQWLHDLGAAEDTVIYAGLGATIDRTGLSWPGLLDALLAKYVPERTTRRAIEGLYDPTQLATVLDGYHLRKLNRDDKDFAEQRENLLRDEIHDVLYGPREVMRGRLTQAIAELALQITLAGKHVIVVTPNYDEYLRLDLTKYATAYALREADSRAIAVKLWVVDDESTPKPETWQQPDVIDVVHVHGYVAKDPEQHKGSPVLSEGDYGDRSPRTREVLRELFTSRRVIIVGSSLADTPLVTALSDTVPAEPDESATSRVAILTGAPNIGEVDSKDESIVRAWQDERLAFLGVRPIYVDYYIQVGQFLTEVHQTMRLPDRGLVLEAYSPPRYGFRLTRWWDAWYKSRVGIAGVQAKHHDQLRGALDEIRARTKIARDENLKLEVWVRWHPENSRDLALWASSTGTWRDIYTMRRDSIDSGSPYRAVRLFCGGSPQFLSEDPRSDSRWRRYLGFPVWADVDGGQIPVGVICLASMRADGELHVGNLPKLERAIEIMADVAQDLLSPRR